MEEWAKIRQEFEKNPVTGMDRLFDYLEGMGEANLPAFDAWLLNRPEGDDVLLLGALTISLRWKEELRNRPAFRAYVESVLGTRNSPRDVREMMDGL
jgi:hypothetical protein